MSYPNENFLHGCRTFIKMPSTPFPGVIGNIGGKIIVNLGFTGVYIIFLVLLLNINCGYSLNSAAVLMCTYNLCFEQK